VEDGVVFFLDKVEETTRACNNLLPAWKTHGSPQGEWKVKKTMYRMASSILEEIEQWRENSSTDDTLNSLTSIETFLEEIKEMNFAILREEEEAATEFPSVLRLLIKKIKIAGKIPRSDSGGTTCRHNDNLLCQKTKRNTEEILDRVQEW